MISSKFHQEEKLSLYHNVSLQWSSLNAVIYLENPHQFVNDPAWGQLLSRFRVGKYTEEDIKTINSRCLYDGHTLDFPNDKDKMNTCYACPTNKEQNSIEMSLFEEHLRKTHQFYDDQEINPPDHTILIESIIMISSQIYIYIFK